MKVLITGGSGFIGMNLIDKLSLLAGYTILNLDIVAPKNTKHIQYWKKGDIMDSKEVDEVVAAFQPEGIIHLAARTDTDPDNKIQDYEINIKGSQNMLTAIKSSASVKRVIMTSTQFVNQYQGFPENDEDFAPYTVYGESKVIMERMTRNANLNCIWTIIRPTNIWGPWHIRYPYEFWKIVSKGLYFHPGTKPVIRSYGYVGNVVSQIISILKSPAEKIDRKVFYVGDDPINIYDWVNGFSVKQTGKSARVIPRFFLKCLAGVGDILSIVNISFPLTSSRYKSMTHSNTAPMQKTFDAFGLPPYTLEEGINETIKWMKEYHPSLINRKQG